MMQWNETPGLIFDSMPIQANSTLTNLYDFVVWALNPETLNPKPYFRVVCRSSAQQSCLGHFQGVVTVIGALYKPKLPTCSFLYPLNPKP